MYATALTVLYHSFFILRILMSWPGDINKLRIKFKD